MKQVKKFDPLSKSFVIVEVSNNEVIKELKTTQPQKLPLSPIIEEKKPKNKSVKSQHQRELDIIKLKTNELLTMSNPSEKTLRQTISYINKFYSSELQDYQKKLQAKLDAIITQRTVEQSTTKLKKENSKQEEQKVNFKEKEIEYLPKQSNLNLFFQNANQEMQKFLDIFNNKNATEKTINRNAKTIINKYKDLRKEAKFAIDTFHKKLFYERYAQVKNILNKNKKHKLSKQEAINKAKEIEIEQQRRVNEYQALLAQEELERIAAKKSSKEETQLNIIEVKASDFCSVKSRACLQSIFVSSIRLPFYNAMVRFLNDDETQTEINYVYKNGILTFNIPGDSLVLNLDNQDKTLIEYLSNNNYTPAQSNIIYDTVSVLLYISQYVKKKNPIQTKQQLLQPIPQEIFIKTIDTALNTKTSIIKVDFTKINAAVEGRTEQKATSSLTSHAKTLVIGYWRNQKYKDGYKLIWIAPFWRGNGQRIKEKLYKII